MADAPVLVSEAHPFPVRALQRIVNRDNLSLTHDVKALPWAVRMRLGEVQWFAAAPDDNGPRFPFLRDAANPGQAWNAGCGIDPDIPRRRFLLGGVAGDRCFVVYETGGFGVCVHIALFCLVGNGAILEGISSNGPPAGAVTPEQLQAWLRKPETIRGLTSGAAPPDSWKYSLTTPLLVTR